MRYFLVPAAILGTLALNLQQPRDAQRGGPSGVFNTTVPDSPMNVIAGAPTDHSIDLSILSKSDENVSVTYTASGKAENKTFALKVGIPTTVKIANLVASTRYRYTVDGQSSHVSGSFVTARKQGESFVFDVQADSHLDENTSTEVYANTLQNEITDQPDFMIDLGDTFMVDKYVQFSDSAKQYSAQRYWFSLPGSQMSIYLCLGNHDGETGWRQRGGSDIATWAREQRERYFPVIRNDGFYSGAPAKGLYYSWTWGDALFVILDPFVATVQKPRSSEDAWDWTLGQEQYNWLKKTLQSSKAKHKFFFIHHLVGGLGKEARGGVEAADRFEWGDNSEFPTRRTGWAEPIHSLMKRYGVNAIFHGHDHLYDRQQRDGIQYMEVPQPSAARENTRSAEEYGYKSGILLSSPGHIRVTVGKDTVKYEYVKSRLVGKNRDVVDSFQQGR